MRGTFPFAYGALRELAAIWQSELAQATSPADLAERRARLVDLYLQISSTEPDAAARNDVANQILALHAEAPLAACTLESLVDAANEQGDTQICRRVLQLLSKHEDADVRVRALERLGDVFEQLGDRRAAIESWRPAARLRDSSAGDQKRARRLYERVLDAEPSDTDAAERLVRIYAEADEWQRIPEVLGVILRADGDRGSRLLLGLESNALEAGALDPFVSMVDEAAALRTPSSTTVRELRRAKARALAQDPARRAEASLTYRSLLENFGSEEDRRAYEAFIDAGPDAHERHWEHRWLYQWRVRREPQPRDALLAWANAEEEHGALDEAAAVYRRALEVVPQQEQPALALKVAELLQRLGRADEALAQLVPVLTATSPAPEAHAMARRMLGDSTSGVAAAERIEAIANGLHGAESARLFAFLVEARDETRAMVGPRLRWYRRLLELSDGTPDVSLTAIVQGAIDLPHEISLWETAERMARARGELGVVVRAYGQALTRKEIAPKLAEALGRRMVALEGECAIEASFFVEVLENVLEHAPSARWALDRVKLALGAQGRWDALFRLYDRAIAVADLRDRAELYDEAAFAARDLAHDAGRAIAYVASIHALRPEDLAISTALERLYEREDKKLELIALLSERVRSFEDEARRDVQRRIAVLWLELGNADEASQALETMIGEGADVAALTDLLEKIARYPGQGRMVDRLCAHYESTGRMADAVRVTEAALARAEDAKQREERAARMRELVRFRIRAAQGTRGGFAGVIESIAADVAGDPRLAKVACRAALLHAVTALKQAPTDADVEEASEGARLAVFAMKRIFLEAGDPAGASRLLVRAARLPFERRRQRELLHEAALVCEEHAHDRDRAIRLFTEIFQEDSADSIASGLLDRFAALLDAAGEHEKLASLWEEQARLRAGNDTEACACCLRAAARWEERGVWERAVQAYGRGAAFGSEESFEALARIHAAQGQWKEAVAALEWLCAHSSAEALGRRTLRLADAYVASGLGLRARACLENLLATTTSFDGSADARARLMALYRHDRIWRPLVDMLLVEARVSEDPKAKVAYLCEAAQVLRAELSDPEKAVTVLEQAAVADPTDRAVCSQLAELLETLERWDRVDAVSAAQVALYGEQRSKERALAHHRRARALVHLHHPEEALAQLRTAAKMHPTHAPILRDLGQAAVEAGDLELAERTYRALLLAVRHPTGDSRAVSCTRVFLDLSAIAQRKGDTLRAVNLLESALDSALENGEDPIAVEHALRSMGRYDLAVRSIEWRVERAPNEATRVVALRELADVWREHLGQEPELAARIRKYAEMAARVIDQKAQVEDAAWTALWFVRASLEDAAAMLTMVRRRIDVPGAPKEWLVEAASFCVKISDFALAARAYTALFEAAPRDRDVWATVEAACRRSPMLERIAPLLEAAIAKMDAGADRASLRVMLAKLLLTQPGKHDAALGLLASALDENPEAPEFFDVAWPLGRALERAGQTKDAERLYVAILDRGPKDHATIRALVDRLEAVRSARVADCIELCMELDRESARALAPRLIELRDAEDDSVGVVRALELGLAADPTNGTFIDRLVAIHEGEWDWAAVTRVLRRAVDAAPRDRALFRRLLDAQRAVGADDEALHLLDAAIEAEPKDGELLCLRARARENAGNDEGAVSDVHAAGEAAARHTDLVVPALRRIVGRAAPALLATRALVLVDVLVRAKRFDEAGRELDSLLARNPNHEGALERVGSLATAAKSWDRAAAAYGRLVGILEGAAQRDSSRFASAVVAFAEVSERAGRPGDARASLERALQLLPDHEDLARHLERVCEATGDAERLAALISARAEKISDAQEKAKLLFRAASLLLHTGAAARALPWLELARSADPESVDVALACARAHVALGRPRDALAPLYDIVERSRGRRWPLLASVYLEMGKAHLALDELVEALEALKAGFAIDLRSSELAMLAGLVAVDLGDEKTAERALLAVATLAPKKDGAAGVGATRADKAVALYHLASMAYAKDDVGRARKWAVKALAENPAHEGALALVERIDAAPVAACAPRR